MTAKLSVSAGLTYLEYTLIQTHFNVMASLLEKEIIDNLVPSSYLEKDKTQIWGHAGSMAISADSMGLSGAIAALQVV